MGLSDIVLYLLLGYLAVKIASYVMKLLKPGKDVTKFGSWAVVTGATDGIGKGFAAELAGKGLNIVLVSRTKEKLEAVATELEEKYKIKTKIIVVDFTEPEAVYDKIVEGIKGLENDIGVLVNNVGVGYDHPEYFLEIENLPKKSRDMVSVNVSSIINTTRAILPSMAERKTGAIINLSSFSGLSPAPLMCLYSGTKAFVVSFSRDLQTEYEAKGVTVLCLTPFYVVSNMSKVRKPTLLIPTAATYCRSALKSLGVESVATGYWAHDIVKFVSCILTTVMPKYTFNHLWDIRRRALKKKQKTN